MATVSNLSQDNRGETLEQPDSIISNHTERVIVALDLNDPAHPGLKLIQQNWATGLGWVTQKTLWLEVSELPKLLTALGQAGVEAKLQGFGLDYKSTAPNTKLIQFPNQLQRKPSKPIHNSDKNSHEARLLPFKPRCQVS